LEDTESAFACELIEELFDFLVFQFFITVVNAFTLLYSIAQCKQIKVISFPAQYKNQEARKMENEIEDKERFFSVELKSKADLKNVTLANGSHDRVLVEGSIGELVQAMFAEGVILEVVGKKGTLRINLKDTDMRRELQGANSSEGLENGTEEKASQGEVI
jgi:hypothetical protein